MAAPRSHTTQQSTALRAEIHKRYCCGQSQQAIADALGLVQSAVSYHLKQAREATSLEIESRRADRLTELDHLRSEAWTAWGEDRSPQAVAFLAQIQKAIAQERALLGLDAQRTVSTNLHISELPTDTIDAIIDRPQAP